MHIISVDKLPSWEPCLFHLAIGVNWFYK